MNRNRFEKKASRLIGKTIVRVVYHEINYLDGEFHFFDDLRFDSIDYGVAFEFDTGELLSIIWGDEFLQYGISLIDGPFSLVISESRHLDVSETPRWYNVLGKTIDSVEVFWSWSEEAGKPETRVYYPQDLLLWFGGKLPIIISALEIQKDGFVMGMKDNITIFNDIHIAKNFKCLQKE